MKRSLIYSNIHLYRLAMNLLYSGGYRQRFANILDVIGPEVRSVCELCFGDTHIAQWCRSRHIEWTGADLNRSFCERARKLGFNVIEGNVLSIELPRADVFVMAGSLYHFHNQLSLLFDRVLARTSRLVVSEPIRNLSGQAGPIGWWARRSANPGDGNAKFRYDQQTMLAMLRNQQQRLRFRSRVVSMDRDLLVEITSS